MAGGEITTISVYNKTGSTLLFTEEIDWSTITIGELLEYPNFVNNNITEISSTIGGQPLNHDDNPIYYTYYDVSPQAETVTGFFLDGQEYVLGGSGGGGDVLVSSQANNILTSGMKIWAGTESDYSNLGTYDQNTIYLTI